MPELPEVESVRRSLRRPLAGARLAEVRVRRRAIVRGPATPEALLEGDRVVELARHGKQLALIAESGRCLCLHLGMTGFLGLLEHIERPPDHTHLAWRIAGGPWLIFRDVRRFGGVWPFAHRDRLWDERWGRLGSDALAIAPDALASGLKATRRSVKTALLDQRLIAGLGNIYGDELLHRAGIRPTRRAGGIGRPRLERLARLVPKLLGDAIRAGGSTFRDYADGTGRPGRFQEAHRVYGRAGAACRGCGTGLRAVVVDGRRTVYCRRCQR